MSSDIPKLPIRPDDGHKGTFGTVCVLGGRSDDNRVMVGGPALAALGALRAGCGLAVLAVPSTVMAGALVIAPSATGLSLPVDESGSLRPSDVAHLMDRYLASFRCLAIGPGLGDGIAQQQVVIRMINQDLVPMVIDADALNCLAATKEFHRELQSQAVLTPHPGEYARLATNLGIKIDSTVTDARPEAAQQLAQRLGCVVVLKGKQTVISDGIDTHTNETGNVALATAGTGDVLTGVIAGLIAQFFKPSLGSGGSPISAEQQGGLSLMECARVGVYIHGLAADTWSQRNGNAGLLAGNLLAEIPSALAKVRQSN